MFLGNTFEGHTLLPVVEDLIRTHKIEHFTVVADAAMISTENVDDLREAGIHYIVGVRPGNLKKALLAQVDDTLERKDGSIIRIETDRGSLICSFPKKRYNKDKHEMQRQIDKARELLQQPSKIKRVRYIKTQDSKTTRNEALVEKTERPLGVKGHHTDIEAGVVDNATIIERYHELYRGEQAFRVSKHDLRTRPIFHFKSDPIQLHILVCFMALVVSKHIEVTTQTSIRAFHHILQKDNRC